MPHFCDLSRLEDADVTHYNLRHTKKKTVYLVLQTRHALLQQATDLTHATKDNHP